MIKSYPTWVWAMVAYLVLILSGIADWITGYELSFVIFYLLPVSISAWFLGLWHTLVITLMSAMVWFGADALAGYKYSSLFSAVWNGMVRLATFLILGLTVFNMKEILYRERKNSEILHLVLLEIKLLEGFLPICTRCKKIHNQHGDWQQIEVYAGQHSNTQLPHSYCPDCAKKVMQEEVLSGEGS